MKVRQKPIELEVYQMNSEADVIRFRKLTNLNTLLCYPHLHGGKVFDNLHQSWIEWKFGDWIVIGLSGETYPITDQMLVKLYDVVDLASSRPPE